MAEFFDRDALRSELGTDEGRSLRLYHDSLNIETIGVGHNLRDRGISNRACDLILDDDIDVVVADLDLRAPWWRSLPPAQARVLLNLCFNMGWARLSEFVHFLAAMRAHDWPAAADALRQSVWWVEVGQRGPRMVQRLTGAAASKG